MEDRNNKRADSHVAEFEGESDIREHGTQIDLTSVICHWLSQCGHPNTESPIDPLLISPAPRSLAERTTMATKAPQAMNL